MPLYMLGTVILLSVLASVLALYGRNTCYSEMEGNDYCRPKVYDSDTCSCVEPPKRAPPQPIVNSLSTARAASEERNFISTAMESIFRIFLIVSFITMRSDNGEYSVEIM